MKEHLKLNATDGFLRISFQQILNCLKDRRTKHWYVLWVSGTLKRGLATSYQEIENLVNESESGLHRTYSELLHFIEMFATIEDLVVLGDANNRRINRDVDDEVLIQTFDFFIEMVDASYWDVYGDTESISGLRSSFCDT